ncbi:cytochrome P450 [Nonomuraea soli]|uniref:Pentalenolactone synthase n=1 Tax=Nonomuraea soli TaxID=1032476 RepID=A0A7W0CI42_9ACTN|nr:cytochrome P450 [Nonomuraea soli]MBA2891479.1 pentalenolactone synthase [Nonomuraea soli]
MTENPTILPLTRPDPMTPPTAYAELRAVTPIAPVRTPEGVPAWLVTSYDAATTVLSDRRFGIAPPDAGPPGHDTLFQDGEVHLRLRRLVSAAFTPRAIAALRPRVERLAEDQVAALVASARPADLVSGFAAPLSTSVIGEVLGVELGKRDHFQALVRMTGSIDYSDGGAAARRAWEDLAEYAAELVAAKRADPGDDLLTALIAVRDTDDGGGRLSDAELVAMVSTIVAGGYLTACNAIAVATIRLLGEGRLHAMAADPGEAGAVLEETLRLQSGLTGEPFPRYAQVDVELGGVAIGKGEMVLVRLEAAQRDPGHVEAPDEFRPGQAASPTLAFGHGPHYCLGAALARVELAAALGALARGVPGLRLACEPGEVEWTTDSMDVGPVSLPVSW